MQLYTPLVQLTSSDGTFAAFDLALLNAPATDGEDEESPSGLNLAAGPGASVTIAFSASAAGVVEFLVVQGHDI